MSLNTNLKKIFDSHFRNELGIEVIKNQNTQINEQGETISSIPNEGRDGELLANLTDLEGGNGFLTSITDEKINDIAVLASRENLELGCMLIKKKVIEKALRKVREDI